MSALTVFGPANGAGGKTEAATPAGQILSPLHRHSPNTSMKITEHELLGSTDCAATP